MNNLSRMAAAAVIGLSMAVFSPPSSATVLIQEVHVGSSDYLELVNIGPSAVDLAGYELTLFEGSSGTQLFTLPTYNLAFGGVVVVSEHAGNPGDIGTSFNILWTGGSDLSVTLRDTGNNVIDFLIAGNFNTGVPAGATPVGVIFNPAPVSPGFFDENTESYQRVNFSGFAPFFQASDWTIGQASRFEAAPEPPAAVPKPGVLALIGLAFAGLGIARRKRTT